MKYLALFLLTLITISVGQDVPTALMIRDFMPSHPDFQSFGGGSYSWLSSLSADGKPQLDTSVRFTHQVTSEASFNEWFRSGPTNFPILKNGVYDFVDTNGDGSLYILNDVSSFFPINGEGFGDYSDGTNVHFTTEIHVEVTAAGDGSDYVKFTSDDDGGCFLDGEFVVNLAGMHAPASRTTDDSFPPSAGTHLLSCFHVERKYTYTKACHADFTGECSLGMYGTFFLKCVIILLLLCFTYS
jgi:hypothetical protein